jgi:hypothetical protein
MARVYLIEFDDSIRVNYIVALVDGFEEIIHFDELNRGRVLAVKHLEELNCPPPDCMRKIDMPKARVVDLRPRRTKK